MFSLSIDGLMAAKHSTRGGEVLVNVADGGKRGAVKPFRMKGETSRISWIMVARSDDSTSKSPVDQKPLVNLRTVEYRGTLNIGWIPDHGVEFFTLFVVDLHGKWRKNMENARQHQATNVCGFFVFLFLFLFGLFCSVWSVLFGENGSAHTHSTPNCSAAEAKTGSSSAHS